MLIQAALPAFLKPKPTAHLVRIGRTNDGGYLVDERDVAASDVLLGFGIRDDWSFEKDFDARKPVEVYAFDPTISGRQFFNDFIKAVPRIYRPWLARHRYRIWSDYKKFFSGNHRHIERYVGETSLDSSVSLLNIVKEHAPDPAKKVFLKIDIEGSEYRILKELVKIADRITGAVIEFHDVDLHLDRIDSFLERFPLRLCHVHGNNYLPLSSDSIPTIVECSFTSQTDEPSSVALPHPLDMPNNPEAGEYRLTF